jgi:hypothetical protein
MMEASSQAGGKRRIAQSGRSLPPTVQELLNGSHRGAMFFEPVHPQHEIRAEELADLSFRVAPDFKSAATRGSLGTERGKNKMSPRP